MKAPSGTVSRPRPDDLDAGHLEILHGVTPARLPSTTAAVAANYQSLLDARRAPSLMILSFSHATSSPTIT